MIFLLSKVKNQKVRLIPAGPARGHVAPPGTAPTPPTAPPWGLVLGVPQDFGGDSPEHTPPTRFCSPIFQHKGAGSVPRGDEEGAAVPAAPRRQLRHLTPSSQVGPGFGGKVPAPGPPTPLCSRRSWKSPPKPTGTQPIVGQRHRQPTSPSPVPQPSGFLENHLPARPRNRILPSAALQTNLGMITASVSVWVIFLARCNRGGAGSRSMEKGPSSQQILHGKNEMMLWELVRPSLCSFSCVLQGWDRSASQCAGPFPPGPKWVHPESGKRCQVLKRVKGSKVAGKREKRLQLCLNTSLGGGKKSPRRNFGERGRGSEGDPHGKAHTCSGSENRSAHYSRKTQKSFSGIGFQ